MATPEVQAITFDVGGTLIQPTPSVGHIYAKAANRHGHNDLDIVDLNRRFLAAWRNRSGFEHSFKDWAHIVDETFRGLVPEPPSQTFFPELYSDFAKPEAWSTFDDVLPTLEELASRGIPLAIVSNWDERLRPLLRSLNLNGYFETIQVSCEIYFTKPSTVIFEHALRGLGVPAESVLHVGDSVAEDVNGARAAGLQAALIDRLGSIQPGRITSLTEVIDLLPHHR